MFFEFEAAKFQFSFNHDTWTSGSAPMTLHTNVALSPSVAVTFFSIWRPLYGRCFGTSFAVQDEGEKQSITFLKT